LIVVSECKNVYAFSAVTHDRHNIIKKQRRPPGKKIRGSALPVTGEMTVPTSALFAQHRHAGEFVVMQVRSYGHTEMIDEII
jgi:hypothetical protein